MSLESLIRNKKVDTFSQGKALKARRLARRMGGVCLTLSCTFIHLRRQGLTPQQILPFLAESRFFDNVVRIHQAYTHQGEDYQELHTLNRVHASVLQDLVTSGRAEPGRALLAPLGELEATSRMPRFDLFGVDPLALRPRAECRLVLMIFGTKGGGAHAIAVDCSEKNWGIFDPNFGWMALFKGFNSVDLGVALNTFQSEYGFRAAKTLFDATIE